MWQKVLGLVRACAHAQPRHCENVRAKLWGERSWVWFRPAPTRSPGTVKIFAPAGFQTLVSASGLQASRNAMLVSTRLCLILLGQTVLGLVQACANAQPRHRDNFRSCYFRASGWRPPHHHPTSEDTWGEAFWKGGLAQEGTGRALLALSRCFRFHSPRNASTKL